MSADLRAGIEEFLALSPDLQARTTWHGSHEFLEVPAKALRNLRALLATHPTLPVADCGHVPTLDPDGRTASCHSCGRMWPLSYLAEVIRR